jgi:cytochrome c553
MTDVVTGTRRTRQLSPHVLGVLCLAASRVAAQTPLETTVNRYCVTCHNDKLLTAGLSLTAVASAPSDTLEKVLRKLRAGEMPPARMPAPDAATRSSVVRSLETQLDQAAAEHPNPGAPGIHRLNRAEYRNAVRDLVGLDMDGFVGHSADLPPDDSGYGFDNIADALTVSPLHMEKYLASARRIAGLAVGTLKPSVSSEKISPSPGVPTDSIDALPPPDRGGILFHRYFPFDAEYSFLLHARGNPAPGLPPAKLDLRLDGRRVKLFEAAIDTAEVNQGTRNFEIRLNLPAGDHAVGAGFLTESVKVEDGPARTPGANGLSIDYVTVGGPYNPTGPGDTESRRRIFVCRPTQGQAEEICARQILSNLVRRAYRRPVNAADLAPLIQLFANGRADGNSFDDGIAMALTGILVSPDFLFRTENTPPGVIAKVSDLELASRLSFFLWSSIPDEELLHIAETGKLRDPDTLARQVRRMIADPKSRALEENFAGQWLHLRNVAGWKPDTKTYPQFDEALRYAFERESDLFFSNIMHEDRSVLEFIDADYTFLNERLARHYGIPGVQGSYFRKVELKDNHRGGVLSQGAILLVTSYPTRTSPVLRGKWILENILGAPPPPPPANVPPLADSAAKSAHTLREQLEKHRADPACASCHAKMDPLGFSLEQYDAIGHFRTVEGGAAIEASGALPDGTAVDGPEGLKKVVLDRRDDFVECLAAKMLTYALGRGLEPYDQPAVRAIRRQAASDDYRFSSLVLGIVNSVPFQMRKQLP